MLAHDFSGAGRGCKPLRRGVLRRTGLTVVVRIVDDHREAAAKLHEPRHDLGLVEVVRDDPHLRAGIGDRPVEDGKHRFARFKSHPVERALRLFRALVCGGERQAVGGLLGQELRNRRRAVPIHERLGRHEAARKGEVDLARIRFAPQLDRHLLRLAVAQFIQRVHEDRADAIDEGSWKFGVPRKMHPAELLDRGQHR